MNIFFDLDGTLIDSRWRLYTLFTELIKPSKITFDEYWKLKRSMFSNEWILDRIYSLNSNEIDDFNHAWLKKIEEPYLLNLDTCFDFTIKTITNLYQQNIYLFVVTSRQKEQAAILQLETLGLSPFFKDTLVTKQKSEKNDLIRSMGIKLDNSDYIIGDTGKDVQAGKQLGIKTVAVLSGFRNYESLIPYKPDLILSSISELPNIIT